MNLFHRIQKVLNSLLRPKKDLPHSLPKSGPGEPTQRLEEEIHSIWDHLKLYENTQAFHLTGILTFDEWLTMEEIKRRILELYGVSYKNDRSLYPYVKTMVDLGLLESHSAGGKRKWRKKDLLIRLKRKKKNNTEEKEAVESVKEEASEKEGD